MGKSSLHFPTPYSWYLVITDTPSPLLASLEETTKRKMAGSILNEPVLWSLTPLPIIPASHPQLDST